MLLDSLIMQIIRPCTKNDLGFNRTPIGLHVCQILDQKVKQFFNNINLNAFLNHKSVKTGAICTL